MRDDAQYIPLVDECPACGRPAGWTGETTAGPDGRCMFRMRCGHCENEFDNLNPEWERLITPRP